MYRRSWSIALIPLFLVLACGDSASDLPPGVDPGTELAITRLPESGRPFGYFSGLRQPVRTVVRTNDAWTEMWAAIQQGTNPVPPVPAIDFGTEMVIVAAMGEQRSTGYAITIERVSETGDGGIDAIVHTRRPGTGCVVGAALTQPLDIVRVPRRDGAVRFWEQDETVNC